MTKTLNKSDVIELNFRNSQGYTYIGIDENGKATFFMLKPNMITSYGSDKKYWYIEDKDHPNVHIVRGHHYTVAEVGTFEGLDSMKLYYIDELLRWI